jgi:predicted NUDIX family phosphoesterase
MTEQVLVFRKELFPQLSFSGLNRDTSLLPDMLARAEFLDRERAEVDPSFKQVIPYSILRYEDTVLSYRRSAWGSEPRLHGLSSIGVGGHINKSDVLPLLTEVSSILDWARDRELAEEFHIERAGPPRLIGLLNDDSIEVARYHLGVVYEYRLNQAKAEPREKRLHLHHQFVPIPQLLAHREEYEGWSQMIIMGYLTAERS